MAKKWTAKEEKFLKKNFDKMNNKELAKKLGVSESSIRAKASKLGLSRSTSTKKRATKKTSKKTKAKNKNVTRDMVSENIRCRQCLIVDGYTKDENTCRHCGAELFKGDVL